jgi:HYDIN/CFA65/VesB family protein
MTITGISLKGTNLTDFQQTHSCGTTLTVGAKCTISVSFKPTASGTRTGDVSIADNAAPPNPQTVVVSGTGTVVKLVPTSLSLGNQPVGTTSAAKTLTMTNVGTTTLNISGISVTGINAGDFSQTHTCGATLGAGASCTISVKFHPSAIGARSAAVSISDNGGGSPQKVPLSGTGT